MQLKGFVTYAFVGVSAILFIRASIIPLYAVYGDPDDEIFMSLVSLLFIAPAFAFSIKKGSYIIGSIMLIIGGYYIWNGYRLLVMVSEKFAEDSNVSSLVNINIYTMILGIILVALG